MYDLESLLHKVSVVVIARLCHQQNDISIQKYLNEKKHGMADCLCYEFIRFYCCYVSDADRTHQRKHVIDCMYVDGKITQVVSRLTFGSRT
jgi:hypothetical protein